MGFSAQTAYPAIILDSPIDPVYSSIPLGEMKIPEPIIEPTMIDIAPSTFSDFFSLTFAIPLPLSAFAVVLSASNFSDIFWQDSDKLKVTAGNFTVSRMSLKAYLAILDLHS